MKSICEHFGDVYELTKKNPDSDNVGMLDEAVFDELDKTEQQEFPDIEKQIKQRKARCVAASFKFEKAMDKKAKGLAKAKAKKRKAQTGNAARAKRQRRRGAEDEPAAEHDQPEEGEEPEEVEVAAEEVEAMEPVVPDLPVPAVPAVEVPHAVPAAPVAVGAARGALVRRHEGYIPWEEAVCEICQDSWAVQA
jgi:hypothetical protein